MTTSGALRAGKATCARCGEPIHPEDDWHLDHNADRNGYLGPSHASCNLAAAAAVTNGRRPPTHSGTTTRPSAIVYGNERVIYMGNGEWQPLADQPGTGMSLNARQGPSNSAPVSECVSASSGCASARAAHLADEQVWSCAG